MTRPAARAHAGRRGLRALVHEGERRLYSGRDNADAARSGNAKAHLHAGEPHLARADMRAADRLQDRIDLALSPKSSLILFGPDMGIACWRPFDSRV